MTEKHAEVSAVLLGQGAFDRSQWLVQQYKLFQLIVLLSILKKFANGETHPRLLPASMTISEATTNLHVHVDPNPAVSEIHRQWLDLEARATPTFYLSSSWIDTLLEAYQYR